MPSPVLHLSLFEAVAKFLILLLKTSEIHQLSPYQKNQSLSQTCFFMQHYALKLALHMHVPPHFCTASYVHGLCHHSVAKAGFPFLFLIARCLCELVTMEIEYIDHWIEHILSSD